MAVASFTAAKFLAPVAARSGGDRAPAAAGVASARPRRGAQRTRLRTALAVSSDVLAGNNAAHAAAGEPVRKSVPYLVFSPVGKSDIARLLLDRL
jgi:pyruvate dehydrogenase E1 component alpha subunit